MLREKVPELPLDFTRSRGFALISSVPLWGGPAREHRGQRRPGQPEKLHLLLQASQSRLSNSRWHWWHRLPAAPRTPPAPVWPGMQSSYQPVSSPVHPQGAGHCHSVEKYSFSPIKKKKKHIWTRDTQFVTFSFAEQNARLRRVEGSF